mgnify:CR=1 FL=1
MLVDAEKLADYHRHCDALFAAARQAAGDGDWAVLGARVGALGEAVLGHFRYEEEHLFPLYEHSSGAEGATEWQRAQHDDMRAALWVLATLKPEAEAARYCTELAALQAAFDAHAADEEKRMYPVFEKMLGRR